MPFSKIVNDYSIEKPLTPHIWSGVTRKIQYSEAFDFFLQKHFNLTDFVIKAIVLIKVIMAKRDIKREKRCNRVSVFLLRPSVVGGEYRFKEGMLL